MEITTPDGVVWTIRSKDEVTERQSREIVRAYMPAFLVAQKLTGFDEAKPETWGSFTALSAEEQMAFSDYQAALISTMTTIDTDPHDLPTAVFEMLAGACSDAYNAASIDTEPDIDPLAHPEGSPS